jgi:hypothetical protein
MSMLAFGNRRPRIPGGKRFRTVAKKLPEIRCIRRQFLFEKKLIVWYNFVATGIIVSDNFVATGKIVFEKDGKDLALCDGQFDRQPGKEHRSKRVNGVNATMKFIGAGHRTCQKLGSSIVSMAL